MVTDTCLVVTLLNIKYNVMVQRRCFNPTLADKPLAFGNTASKV